MVGCGAAAVNARCRRFLVAAQPPLPDGSVIVHHGRMDQTATHSATAYCLDDQVGFLLRLTTQRHLAIFAAEVPSLTPTQFAVLAKLAERGATSQNALGRATAMDAATIKGVADRLRERGLIETAPEGSDRRRLMLQLTDAGRAAFDGLAATALRISDATLAPLSQAERVAFLAMLRRLG